eukprot:g1102.t1
MRLSLFLSLVPTRLIAFPATFHIFTGRPQDLQNARRAKDELLAQSRRAISEELKVQQRAKWEVDTHAGIRRRAARREAQEIERSHQTDLQARRHELAALYNAEMKAWQDEVYNRVETAEDRKESLRRRAEALREERERQDALFVAEKRQQQWLNSADDLRLLESQASLLDVAERRRVQLEEKRLAQLQQLEEDRRWGEAWEADRVKKTQREADDLAKQKRINSEMREDLDLQVKQRRARNARLKAEHEAEVAMTKQRWDEEKALQDEHDAKVKEAERARGRAVLEYNNLRQQKRAEDAKVEMESDLLLLSVALEKERRELESEAAKREQEKEMTKKYQEHLRLQMIKEKEDDSLLEELRRQDEEKTWKKREDQYNREQSARRELHEAVMAGRDEQLRLKAERAKVDADLDLQQVQIFKRENKRLAELDAQALAAQKQAAIDNGIVVSRQIAVREAQRRKKKQDEFLELKQMQHAEKEYQAVLSNNSAQFTNSVLNRSTSLW